MGQRHQIYLRLPEIYYNPRNANNRKERTVGCHHQWLYGNTAIRQLSQFLKFSVNNLQDDYNVFSRNSDEALNALTACYSINIETGYYHGVWGFNNKDDKDYGGECEDPRKGDNNNGITIIDIASAMTLNKSKKLGVSSMYTIDHSKIGYCFLSIGHLECLDETKKKAYVNFSPIDAIEWIKLHYGDDWELKFKKDNGYQSIQAVEDIQKTFKLITPKRLAQIFPKLKVDLKEGEKAYKEMLDARKSTSVKFIESIKKEKK
jgi:hypothetical protein